MRLDGREALQNLMAEVKSGQADFKAILVYDVSRWGWFQDADEGDLSRARLLACRAAGERLLAIRVARKLKATDVIEALCKLFVSRGVPAHIRSDNGPEFVAIALRDWIAAVGAKTAYIEPGMSVGERLLRKLQRQTA